MAEKTLKRDIPEIRDLFEATKHGIRFICDQLNSLDKENNEADLTEVVKCVKDSAALAKVISEFYALMEENEEQKEMILRGGAKINKFELPYGD